MIPISVITGTIMAIIAARVAYLLIENRSKDAWMWIVVYWIVLVLKNVADALMSAQ